MSARRSDNPRWCEMMAELQGFVELKALLRRWHARFYVFVD